MSEVAKAQAVYNLINTSSKTNTVIQAASGFFGGLVPWAADAYAIANIYVPLVNDIRQVYGQKAVDAAQLGVILKGGTQELIADLVIDKVGGNIPVVGIYFNAICAKSMTWRIGILFAMLSAHDHLITEAGVNKAIKLIRLQFPMSRSAIFSKPDFTEFQIFLSTMSDCIDFEKTADDLIAFLISNNKV